MTLTVQQLIDKLNEVEDKSIKVYLSQDDDYESSCNGFHIHDDCIILW